ncbi:glycoside hydrolase family 2 TIM barrel-domain containing protein [Dyadobacter psychrophilus]|uniref:glycoside hydrolase family 2 TIM barrel-domain containing protein n=1 Tax=Dyadobacter psychrophilus TaxID=651661 RepID=UPI001E39761B|nr:glycoside hydrolase family 2 TIM barrel-domain containing protein [Dyadobacter psychrophilus]
MKAGGGYRILRNRETFLIKGASGDTHFRKLAQSGGNCLRIWDTTNLMQVLDSAHANNIAIIAGLPIQNSDQMSLYDNPDKTAQQLSAFKSLVNRHKNHPALLMWCVGNELDFPSKPAYNNFYKGFNALTDMIRSTDPDHPITTTVLNFNTKYIANIKLRCDIDVISFNIFNLLDSFRDDLKAISWFWDGPYMLLEWGTDGPWTGSLQTAWGAFIEHPSKKKADVYLRRYQEKMPVEDPRFLGSFAFFWGNKQETTNTWFSMFDESGAASEPVAIMQYLWTNQAVKEHYPAVKYMLLNKKGAADNVMVNPGEALDGQVVMFNSDSIKSVEWKIFREDWYKKNHQNSTKELAAIDSLYSEGRSLTTRFQSPSEEGPYRIFAKISGKNGNFATCNTPFYVVSDK